MIFEGISLLIALYLIISVIIRLKSAKYVSPPGPKGIPYFGYLPSQLGINPYETLSLWSKQYGDLFSLKIAGRRYFVLNSCDLIRKAYVLDGSGNNFSSRPHGFNGLASVFQSRAIPFLNGPEWSYHRKLFSSLIRGSDQNVEATVIKSAENIVNQVQEFSSTGEPVDIHKILVEEVMNVISSLVCGQRLMETDPTIGNQIVEDSRLAFENIPGGNGFMSGWLMRLLVNPLTQRGQTLKGVSEREFKIMKRFVDEHEQNFDSSNFQDYIDIWLNERMAKSSSSAGEANWLSTENLLPNVFAFFVAGIESTACNLQFAVFLLAKHADVQEKCAEELRSVLGNNAKSVKSGDKSRLSYVAAVIHEISRYAVVGALPQPRANVLKTDLGGFDIPPGSHFVTNLWAATRDPKYFSNPHEFDPDNFFLKQLPKEVYSLPFSAGKRGCPGKNLANIEMFLFISNLLHRFKMSPVPEKELKEDIIPGFTRCLSPFQLIFSNRE